MISRIHSKLGTAGFIVAIVALVAALGGAAVAAKGGLTGQQKKEVKKIAQTEAKKFPGPAGAAGAPGPAGAPGAKGDTGATGAAGQDGEDGTDGKNGNSVVVTPEAKGANCEAGGVKVTVQNTAGQNFVCNGKDGGAGEPVIPPGESISGHWSIDVQAAGFTQAPISFVLAYPLAAGPTLHYVTVEDVEEEEAPTQCAGSADAPTAAPGHLCVYESPKYAEAEFTTSAYREDFTGFLGELDDHGVILWFDGKTSTFNGGTWVVTAPAA